MERQSISKTQKTVNHLQKQSGRPSSGGHPLLELQGSIGNQAVERLIRSPYIQTKLQVSTPGDPFEQEADRVADTVMRMTGPQASEKEATTQIQPKPIASEITQLVQRESEQSVEEEKEETIATKTVVQRVPLAVREDDEEEKVATKLHTNLSTQLVASTGQPLSDPILSFFEPRLGVDLKAARVHTGTSAAESAESLSARAYTAGNDIVFGAGEYQPHTTAGRRLLAHELVHIGQQQQQQGIQRFAKIRTAEVPSLIVAQWSSTRLPGKWSQVRAKLTQRDRIINQRLALVTPGGPQHATLSSLLARWGALKVLLANTTFDPAVDTLPSRADITQDMTDEQADKAALTGNANRNVRAVIDEFLTAVRRFLDDRDTLDAERTEFHRFDTLFDVPDVATLLAAISNATFVTADVKAIVSQETGDLTNTTVAGISPTKPGIRVRAPNPSHFVGLGQHSPAARGEAITWARNQGVIIPSSPDPRTIPTESIKLVAAYLGRVMDMLHPILPAVKPTGDELKKMTFAAYNGGHNQVRRAADSFLAGVTAGYSWDDIKNQPSVNGQMRKYVSEIVTRLS